MNKEKVVPKIRFKMFNEGLKEFKLGSITDRVRGNDGRMELLTLTISAGKGWLDQRERFSGNIAGKEQKNYTLLRKGELSYNKGNSKLAKYGVVFMLDNFEEALVPRVYHSFRVTKKASARYIEYLFATKKPDRELGKLITSGARMDGLLNINYDDFMGIKITIPKVEEQISIGSFFNKVDKTITLQQQLLNDYKQLKKAILQKMFPQKGETIPKISLKKHDILWDRKYIGDIFKKVESGNRLPKTMLEQGTVPYIIAKTTDNGVFMRIDKDSKDYHDNKMKFFPAGSITFSIDNPEAIYYQEEPFFTSNIMRVLYNPLINNFHSIFIVESMKKLTRNYNWGSKFSGPVVMNSMISLPIEPKREINWDEVEKIGHILSSVDGCITNIQKKIEAYQELKKAMLQRMFV